MTSAIFQTQVPVVHQDPWNVPSTVFDSPWSPHKDEVCRLSCYHSSIPLPLEAWKAKISPVTNKTTVSLSEEPPLEVDVPADWNDDDVSVLADDPDEDDCQLLPQSTFDVLAPLFDEIYRDDSEQEEDNSKVGAKAA